MRGAGKRALRKVEEYKRVMKEAIPCCCRRDAKSNLLGSVPARIVIEEMSRGTKPHCLCSSEPKLPAVIAAFVTSHRRVSSGFVLCGDVPAAESEKIDFPLCYSFPGPLGARASQSGFTLH